MAESPLDGHDRQGNGQGNGDHEGRNDGRPQVSQEEKEGDRDEEYAGGGGFQYLLDHGGDQLPSFIVGDDFYPFGKDSLVQLRHLFVEWI